MSFVLRMLLYDVAALLQSTVKNPQSIASEKGVITEIRDMLNTILAAIG